MEPRAPSMSMATSRLPVEILTNIVQRLIPPRWHVDSRVRAESLRLRLVCRQFDGIVSRVAFQSLRPQSLLLMPVPTKPQTIKWLLLTRVELNKDDPDKAIQFIRNAVLAINTQVAWDLQGTNTPRDYLNAACMAIVAYRGASWSLTTLVCSFRRLTGPPPIDFVRLQIDHNSLPESSEETRLWQAQGLLQLTSCYGNEKAVESLLALGVDPNYQHELFGFALYAAAHRGHADVVRLLLAYGASTNVEGDMGDLLEVVVKRNHRAVLEYLLQTDLGRNLEHVTQCLRIACQGGHEAVATALLGHPGVDVNAEDEIQRTPLLYAGEFGQEGMTRLLLSHADVDINARSFLGHTALVWAARQGWTNIVQDLLAREDINAEPSPEWNESPLVSALYCGHEDIARIFLARDDSRPIFRNRGYCPLWLATKANNGELVSFLLDRYNLDPNQIVRRDLTLLSAAAGLGKDSVVKMLLERDDVDPNYRVKEKHPAPLGLAVRRGHTEVVRLLLQRKDVNPNIMTSWYRPLEKAVLKGYKDIVKLLLSRPDTRVDLHGHPLAPLSVAVSTHRLDIMRLLLERPDIDADQCTRRSAPPLYYAIFAGENKLVEELLRRTDVNPNKNPKLSPSDPGFPLGYAARLGRTAMVRLLLARRDIDINKTGNEGTALIIAIKSGWENVVKLLLSRSDINVNLKSEPYRNSVLHHRLNRKSYYPTFTTTLCKGLKGGEPPLIAATRKGGPSIISLLLEDQRTNKDVMDLWKRTPLWWACYHGHPSVVRLLLDHGAYHINLPDVQGWTPLLVAVNHVRRLPIGSLLLDPRLNPNVANVDGWTALHLAVNVDDIDTVTRLLQHPKINLNSTLLDGRTPLQLAGERGYQPVIGAIKEAIELSHLKYQ